ncbi:uncharacterized protein PV07_04150 [Cladophialophora immunda]|uniref:Xylanolytic transcriptional activator regulatory domain-containing protein n=1 Tax=Cladophialophora immunda TaxID=569365 RepID=A0A0D2DA90_9EURO|nr:uncharacterized protein PV07_04150 [Cladophialophora immunda]KIW32619.1 hypothetical protein PV07_04150 [Cladophialophora immunda]
MDSVSLSSGSSTHDEPGSEIRNEQVQSPFQVQSVPGSQFDAMPEIDQSQARTCAEIVSIGKEWDGEWNSRPSRLLETSLSLSDQNPGHFTEAQIATAWACHFIDQLSLRCKQYLMECFWNHYNSLFCIVGKDIFLQGMETGESQYYSVFLHLAILGVGFLYSDPERPEVQDFDTGISSRGGRISSLHRECRLLMESEMEGKSTVALAQGLLLLVELEIDHDNLAFASNLIGVAWRLSIEINLQQGAAQRWSRGVLWACLIYDIHRSQLLHRSTLLKQCGTRALQARWDTEYQDGLREQDQSIYFTLLGLTELVHELLEKLPPKPSGSIDDAGTFFEMTALYQKLTERCHSLPEALRPGSPTSQSFQAHNISFFQ